ncbi:Rossmann-fold NAD(P)-binding domain-containing protein [Catenuloplanes japonicus]|uniref:hypothetical protein n=1 Tax=Catenuloplanes japonicus TaxID=33876 RepID=UPI000525A255|nr:hypothetical protein [Catenuloplanes japonicus]
MTHVLVTAALGTTGSRVAALLRDRGHAVTAVSRRATGFDWTRPETFPATLNGRAESTGISGSGGSTAAYLVPPPGGADLAPFLDAASRAGVQRAVLLSSSPADPAPVRELLGNRFAEWAVLRPTWFMQNVVTPAHSHALSVREGGTLLTSTDGARVALIDAGDIADVAAALLTSATAPNADLVLTGPEALTYAEVAAIMGVPAKDVTAEELVAYLSEFSPSADRMAALDRIIATGSQARITDTVRTVTGRPARTFRDWWESH